MFVMHEQYSTGMKVAQPLPSASQGFLYKIKVIHYGYTLVGSAHPWIVAAWYAVSHVVQDAWLLTLLYCNSNITRYNVLYYISAENKCILEGIIYLKEIRWIAWKR